MTDLAQDHDSMPVVEQDESSSQEVRLELVPHEGVASLEVVPEEYHDYLWNMYETSFTDLQADTPTLQLMHETDFRAALVDERVTKLFSFTEGQPETMLIYSSIKLSPEYYPWNSLPYFEKNFPDSYDDDSVYYFVGLFTDPAFREKGNVLKLVAPLFDDVASRHPKGAEFIYDCCEANKGLAVALHSLAERYQSEQPENEAWAVAPLGRLGTQTYYNVSMHQN